MAQHDDQGDVAVEKKKKEKTKEPPQYKVLFHNDNYTTMEFVVRALEGIFNKSPAEAVQVMLHVHNTGSGVAGVYSRDVAETKVHQTLKWAQEEGQPLMVTMEPE